LLALGAKIVLLKVSYRGLYLRTAGETGLAALGRARPSDYRVWANRELWSPSFQTTVVGTTGAGDAAIAGLLAALLRELPPAAALTFANAVGACNVEAADAVSGVRSWAETMARLEAGWPRGELDLAAPGWRFDEGEKVWVGRGDGGS
jgi:sugar/nucleoside kinase (ribokinase family)